VHALRSSHLTFKSVPVLANENAHAQLAVVAQEQFEIPDQYSQPLEFMW